MDAPLSAQPLPQQQHPHRGRAVPRGVSRNRQWVAPGHEPRVNTHTSGSDSDRWERGGGPRRAAGRARGRGVTRGARVSAPSGRPAHPQQHQALAVAREDGGTSGAEDEMIADVQEVQPPEETAAGEPPDVVDDEPVLETQEERDEFYKQLVAAREVERQRAIATGKMDDPNVAKRLEDAITMVGTCMDMCPRFERYQRERQHQLDKWELIPNTRRVDHRRAVKRYQRAAGDRVIPSDLRPPPVLKKTLDYLFHTLMPSAPFPATAFFIRDRSRAVRNDFTIQHESGPLAVECHERCARFHAISLHLMAGRPDFDLSLEIVGLKNTLQSLKEFYDDRHGDYPMPHELEMRIYHRLIHIRDTTKHDTVPPHISSNPVFELVTRFRTTVQAATKVVSKDSELKVDGRAMEVFGEMVGALKEFYSRSEQGRTARGERRSRRVMYLVACIMEGVFGQGVVEDVEEIKGDLSVQDVIDGEEGEDGDMGEEEDAEGEEEVEEEMEEQEQEHDTEEQAVWNVPSTTTPTAFPFSQPQPLPQSQSQPPVKSAFSNLGSTANTRASAFGGPTSAFGITFPVSASTTTTNVVPPSVSASVPAPSLPMSVPAQPNPTSVFASPADLFKPPGLTAPSTISTPPSQTAPQSTPPKAAGFGGLNPTAPVFKPPSTLFPSGSPFGQTQAQAQGGSSSPFSQPGVSTTTPPRKSLADAPPLGSGNDNAVQGPSKTLTSTPTLPASAFSTPFPNQPQTLQAQLTEPHVEPHLVDRKQTLWDLPSTTPASIADIQSLVPPKPSIDTNNLGSGSPYTPPPLSKPAPLTLPPTPTVRWFDPSSSSSGLVKSPEASTDGLFKTPEPPSIFSGNAGSPVKTQESASSSSSLALRKQSLGLKGLQIPGVPTSAEILSPLTLGTPKSGIPPPRPPASHRLYANSIVNGVEESPTPGASTSRVESLGASTSVDSTPTTSPEKGKGRATAEDELELDDSMIAEPSYAQMKASAREFARRGSVVRRCFGVWKAKMEENVRWEEACRRSDAYREKKEKQKERERAKKRRASVSDVVSTTAATTALSSRRPEKRRRPRGSAQYVKPVTDEELVRRLKENQEEQQRRWAQGSFLASVRSRVKPLTRESDERPIDWSVWLSLNSENDGTAIWLERKFDVPESGEWVSESVFSIPLNPDDSPRSKMGSPGLIVFERTPLDDLDDPLEKKYRVLDDCARLRDVVGQLQSVRTLRYTPALVVLTWADVDGPDAAQEFGDMTRALLDERILGSVQNVVISAKESNWDTKFDEALTHTKLDVQDKSVIHLTWQGLCNLFLPSFKTHASDWLYSCWTDDQFDWSRYGDVMRSIEHLQATLAREILGLLERGSDIHLQSFPSSLETPSHLDAADATGPFLDSYLRQTVGQIEKALGRVAPSYSVPRNLVGSAQERFEDELRATSEHLRHMAALSLSSRSVQKRRAEAGSESGSPTSTNKRLKLSPATTVSDRTPEPNGDVDQDVSTFLTPPPLSTAPSMATFSERPTPPKTQVTIAMLRALARGVLKSTG